MIGTTEVSSSRFRCPIPRADRLSAIRKTLHFYNEHLRLSVSAPPQLILLSDDRRNREIAQSDGLIAISTREYVDGLVADERDKLVDLVVGGVDELSPTERRAKKIYQDVSPHPLLLAHPSADNTVLAARYIDCRRQKRAVLPGALQREPL